MYLLKVLEERKLSKLQLALNAKIIPSDLYLVLNGKQPFYPAWKKRISDYLQIDEKKLFDEGGN